MFASIFIGDFGYDFPCNAFVRFWYQGYADFINKKEDYIKKIL